MSAEEYLLQSIISPNAYRDKGEEGVMPANVSAGLSRQEVLSLATLGGSPDRNRLVSLLGTFQVPEAEQSSDIAFAKVEAGKALYLGKGKCNDCHPLQRLAGFNLRAPSLLTAARHEEKYLVESITQPSKNVVQGYETTQVVLSSGGVVAGRLMKRGPHSIELLTDSAGRLDLLTIANSEIALDEDDGSPMVCPSGQSAMPDGFYTVLSEAEIELIVAFLKTLR